MMYHGEYDNETDLLVAVKSAINHIEAKYDQDIIRRED
jgi:hypothetical protein